MGAEAVFTDQEQAGTAGTDPLLVGTVHHYGRDGRFSEELLNHAIFFKKYGPRICIDAVEEVARAVEHHQSFVSSYP